MEGMYYVFSDESGHWSQEGLYIRSWVGLSEETYIKLKAKISLFKEINGLKSELKYNENHDYSLFCNLDFDVYFTITFTEEFRSRSFQIINLLDEQDNSFFVINNRNIKERIINSVKNSLFLNIFEYHHLKNALLYFNQNIPNNAKLLVIDTPQYQNRHWVDIFRELRPNNNFKLKIINKSENVDGIQFADILAGTLNKILSNLSVNNIFERTIVSKFSFDNGPNNAFMNNPQIVMWKDEHRTFIEQLKNLRG